MYNYNVQSQLFPFIDNQHHEYRQHNLLKFMLILFIIFPHIYLTRQENRLKGLKWLHVLFNLILFFFSLFFFFFLFFCLTFSSFIFLFLFLSLCLFFNYFFCFLRRVVFRIFVNILKLKYYEYVFENVANEDIVICEM